MSFISRVWPKGKKEKKPGEMYSAYVVDFVTEEAKQT